MKIKNILAENMKRFATKNLSESDYKRIEEQDQAQAQNIDALVKKANKTASTLIMQSDYAKKIDLAKNYGFTWNDATGTLAYEDLRSVGSNKEGRSKFTRTSRYNKLPSNVSFPEPHKKELQKRLAIALKRSGLLDALMMTEGSEITEQSQAKAQNIDALVAAANKRTNAIITQHSGYPKANDLVKNYAFQWDDATGRLTYGIISGTKREGRNTFTRKSNYSRLATDVKFPEPYKAKLQRALALGLNKSGLINALSMTEGIEITEQEQKKEFSLYSSTGKFIRQSRNGKLGSYTREEMEQEVGNSLEKHPNGYKYKKGYPKRR